MSSIFSMSAARMSIQMIPLIVFTGMIIVAILLVLKGGRAGGDRGGGAPEEARLIQDIHHGLQKMEERIEALETILLERERRRGDE